MTQSLPVTIPNTEVRMLQSTVVDQEYQIFIGFLQGYAATHKSFPVLYLLDANLGFGIVEFLRMLQHVQEVFTYKLRSSRMKRTSPVSLLLFVKGSGLCTKRKTTVLGLAPL